MKDFVALGKSGVTEPTPLLESFPTPRHVSTVRMVSDEVTAICKVTSQPDQYAVEVVYVPYEKCIESKSWKLKLQSFRNTGIFCEQLASDLARHILESITPHSVTVKVTQKPRGGVSIIAEAKILHGVPET